MSLHVDQLVKYYRVHHKEVGQRGSLRSLFRRQYETVKAVDGISFDIEQREIVATVLLTSHYMADVTALASRQSSPSFARSAGLAVPLFVLASAFWRFALRYYTGASS